MTFHIPKERPPHLKMSGGIWWCSDTVTCGMGPTKPDAYNDWKSKRALIERMHRNELAGRDSAYDPINRYNR